MHTTSLPYGYGLAIIIFPPNPTISRYKKVLQVAESFRPRQNEDLDKEQDLLSDQALCYLDSGDADIMTQADITQDQADDFIEPLMPDTSRSTGAPAVHSTDIAQNSSVPFPVSAPNLAPSSSTASARIPDPSRFADTVIPTTPLDEVLKRFPTVIKEPMSEQFVELHCPVCGANARNVSKTRPAFRFLKGYRGVAIHVGIQHPTGTLRLITLETLIKRRFTHDEVRALLEESPNAPQIGFMLEQPQSSQAGAASVPGTTHAAMTTTETSTSPSSRIRLDSASSPGKRAILSGGQHLEERQPEDRNQITNVSTTLNRHTTESFLGRADTPAVSAAPIGSSYHNASTELSTQSPPPALPVRGDDSEEESVIYSAAAILIRLRNSSTVILTIPQVQHRQITTASGDEDAVGSDTEADIEGQTSS
ncbi:hypothetical protein BU16DRAFT_567553 [Lophium mytilinum]|uniref:Uncharacterized protein n=1 Tax=Lophium mytilinum TaxID=390894 RepID=A0A6A6QBD5_9PEZI|nr:hypothetical protein BU16DRAFT_567553 [Lophium mytilinum]